MYNKLKVDFPFQLFYIYSLVNLDTLHTNLHTQKSYTIRLLPYYFQILIFSTVNNINLDRFQDSISLHCSSLEKVYSLD